MSEKTLIKLAGYCGCFFVFIGMVQLIFKYDIGAFFALIGIIVAIVCEHWEDEM